MPEKRNPPLKDWFNPVQMIDNLEIVHGCGKRLCRVCCISSPGQIESMPFQLIDKHNQKLDQWNLKHPNKKRMVDYWFRGEPGYYNREHYRISDVVLNVLQYETLHITIPTHGFLIGEQWVEEEFRKLAEIAGKNPGKVGIMLTMDPWGWYGVDDETHLASVAQSLHTGYYEGIQLKVLFNENEDEDDIAKLGSYSNARRFYDNVIQRVNRLPPQFTLQNVVFEGAYNSGRASTIGGARLPAGPDWFMQRYKDRYFVGADENIYSLETWKKIGPYSEL